MADLLERLYETPSRSFTKTTDTIGFTPKIKITIEENKNKANTKQFSLEASFAKHTDKATQERIREDAHARLNMILDQIFQGWK